MKFVLSILYIALSFSAFAQEQVPYTLDDRDRLIRVEERLNSVEKQMAVEFDSVDTRFTFLYWALSILIGLVLINLGYTVWDRRTAIHPIKEKLKFIEADKDNINKKMVEVDKIKAALKEMGESDQKIAEILKRVALF